MSRLVSGQQQAAVTRGSLNAGENAGAQPRVEDYLKRVAAFIPGEVVAAFLLVRGLVPKHGSPAAYPVVLEFVIYGMFFVLAPAYFVKFGGAVPKKALQVVIVTFSFLVWSYAIGGPFFFAALSDAVHAQLEYPGLGGIAVVGWSLAIGLFKPK